MLIVTKEVAMALRYAVAYNPNLEVGGFGRTHLTESGDIVCDTIYIPPQVVQSGHTDIKGPLEEGGDGMLEAAREHFATHCVTCGGNMFDLAGEEGGDHEHRGGSQADWRLWWHSHGRTGSNFASATDHATLFGMAKECGGWAVGLVVSSAPDRYTWVAGVPSAEDPRLPADLRFEKDIKYGEYLDENDEIKAWIDDMMKGVTLKTYAPQQSAIPGAGFSRGNPGGPSGNSSNSHGPALLPDSKQKVTDMSEEEFAKLIAGLAV